MGGSQRGAQHAGRIYGWLALALLVLAGAAVLWFHPAKTPPPPTPPPVTQPQSAEKPTPAKTQSPSSTNVAQGPKQPPTTKPQPLADRGTTKSDSIKTLTEPPITIIGPDKSPDFFTLVKQGNLARVRRMLERDPLLALKRNFRGATALQLTAALGNVEMVTLLLNGKADINAGCAGNLLTGQTALHLAAGQGHLKVVNLLLAHKAAVNARDSSNATPLHEAAVHGQTAVAARLLQAGATIDAVQKDGYTPLFWALLKGHANTAELLIARGANVNARTADGLTPLLFAEMLKDNPHREQLVALLRKRGAKE